MSQKYEITGSVVEVFDTNIISDKFSVREFVLETDMDTDYPQLVKLQCAGKNVPKLDEVRKGDVVTATFNLRGRRYEKKDGSGSGYFTSIDCWQIAVTQPSSVDNGPGDTGKDIPF